MRFQKVSIAIQCCFFSFSAYENRVDLLSVMIEGPKKTPYEDGMFLFDIQLGKEYPRTPPSCHYISYCSDRLNPNLYENGKVCISLLGTWSGRGSEIWGPGSTLLQVIVSIQGLILVAEPYFNEAGYEKQKGECILVFVCNVVFWDKESLSLYLVVNL